MKTFFLLFVVAVFLTAPFGVVKAQAHILTNGGEYWVADSTRGEKLPPLPTPIPAVDQKTGQQATTTQLVFWSPQMSCGTIGGVSITSILNFTNQSQSQAGAQYGLYDVNGKPLTATIGDDITNNVGPGQSGGVSLQAKIGLNILLTCGTTLQVGYIAFTTTSSSGNGLPDVTIQESFLFKDLSTGMVTTAVATPVGGLKTAFIGPGVVDSVTGADTGIALVNPGTTDAHYRVTLRTAGSSRNPYLVSPPMILKAGQHLSLFLSELFPNIPPDELGRPVHDLSIEVDSDQGLSLMLLRKDRSPFGDIYSMFLAFGP